MDLSQSINNLCLKPMRNYNLYRYAANWKIFKKKNPFSPYKMYLVRTINSLKNWLIISKSNWQNNISQKVCQLHLFIFTVYWWKLMLKTMICKKLKIYWVSWKILNVSQTFIFIILFCNVLLIAIKILILNKFFFLQRKKIK